MPVGTNATVKALDPDDLHEVGAQIILSNTYHLAPAAGPRAHRAARRPAPVHGLGRRDPDRLGRLPGGQPGRPALDRRRRRDVSLAPRRLASSASRPSTRSPSRRRSARTSRSASTSRCRRMRRPRREVAEATARTHRWAERCLAAHQRPDQALFGIIQGGLEPDLRAESTRVIAALPFDGICIGGLAGDETPDAASRGARRRGAAAGGRSAAALPDGPRLAGRTCWTRSTPVSTCSTRCCRRGSPATAPCGCPMVGSTCATRASWTTRRPVQEGCRCRACRSFSRAYLAHLFRADELLVYRLATCHNLTFTLDFMAGIRSRIARRDLPPAGPRRAGSSGCVRTPDRHRMPVTRKVSRVPRKVGK